MVNLVTLFTSPSAVWSTKGSSQDLQWEEIKENSLVAHIPVPMTARRLWIGTYPHTHYGARFASVPRHYHGSSCFLYRLADSKASTMNFLSEKGKHILAGDGKRVGRTGCWGMGPETFLLAGHWVQQSSRSHVRPKQHNIHPTYITTGLMLFC